MEPNEATLFAILPGMIRFHLPRGAPELPSDLSNNLRLVQDIGLDSLSLTELVLNMDGLLGVPIETRELVGISTVGDLKVFLSRKLEGVLP
jgi:3-hydroxyacyl-[acyl-carrier-protein] dehydratase